MNNNNNNNLISNISATTDVRLVSPVKSYGNAELLKDDVLKDNGDQSGVYRWVNNLNGNTDKNKSRRQEIKHSLTISSDIKIMRSSLDKLGIRKYNTSSIVKIEDFYE
jgi:hypothetical protein